MAAGCGNSRLASAALHVFLSDPQSFRSLQDFLRRAECVAEQRRSHELDVFVPRARNEREARRELSVYLASWQAANPGVEAYIVDSPPVTPERSR
jgi:hypothetical protein